MSEWQPIDTAPRDGTEILVWMVNCRIVSCYRILRYDVEAVISNRWVNQEFMIWYDEDHIKEWIALPTPPVPETPKDDSDLREQYNKLICGRLHSLEKFPIEREFIVLLDMIVKKLDKEEKKCQK